jgi:hypothetical protein
MRQTTQPTNRRGGRPWSSVLIAAAVLLGALGYHHFSSTVRSSSDVPTRGIAAAERQIAPAETPPDATTDAVTEEDGAFPGAVTVFDDGQPAIANLDPDLLRALRSAAQAAADDGIELLVTSGWRSAAYQDALLEEARAEYGSWEEAARWVATAATSPHVSGDAVDLGGEDALAWLSKRGAEYGLCRIYRNEPWHVEVRPGAIDHGCPPMYADPTHDPRMQP